MLFGGWAQQLSSDHKVEKMLKEAQEAMRKSSITITRDLRLDEEYMQI